MSSHTVAERLRNSPGQRQAGNVGQFGQQFAQAFVGPQRRLQQQQGLPPGLVNQLGALGQQAFSGPQQAGGDPRRAALQQLLQRRTQGRPGRRQAAPGQGGPGQAGLLGRLLSQQLGGPGSTLVSAANSSNTPSVHRTVLCAVELGSSCTAATSQPLASSLRDVMRRGQPKESSHASGLFKHDSALVPVLAVIRS